MRLLVNAPINSLSFGNVSFNILRELFKQGHEIAFFPIGDKIEAEAFDKCDKEFKQFLQKSIDTRYDLIEKNLPTLKLWHIFGSENRFTKNQNLITFHEVSEITALEKRLLNLQDKVFVTSNFTKNIFTQNGVSNVHFVPLGFDPDFKKNDKNYFPNKIHFGIMGKFEKRKNTDRIIKTWLKLFGNNPKYQLSCAITNPFLDTNRFQHEMIKLLDGKQYNNLNLIPRMQTNSEVNDYLNSIDIDLGGLSGGEGWNLPSFNATALGKWSVILNATAHKDWATKDNSILIEPSRLKECYDDVFFKKGQSFNQGSFFDISDEEMENAISSSVKHAKTINTEGLKLQQTHSYKNTVNTLLSVINDTL